MVLRVDLLVLTVIAFGVLRALDPGLRVDAAGNDATSACGRGSAALPLRLLAGAALAKCELTRVRSAIQEADILGLPA
jgi:hypothetical protein